MFVYLGTSEDSWVVGNDYFSVAKNLPGPLQQIWDRLGSACGHVNKVGTLISWMSTAPDGTYAIMTKGGELLSNRQDVLAAARPATSVEHITFSPLGGWFIRFNDGTVQVSHSSGFSTTFHRLVLQYLDLSCQSRQYSPIRNVFFGAREAVIVRTDRELLSAMLSQSLQTSLQALTNGELKSSGFVLGRNTVLCPCDPDQYFLEAVSGTRSKHLYQMLATELPDQLVVLAMEKQSPSDDVLNSFIHGSFSNRLSVSISSQSRPSSFSGLSTSAVNDCSNHRHSISYAAPSDKTPWNSVPQQVTYPQTSPLQEVPTAARQRYEAIFANEARGKPYLNGMEAAGIFMTSGLSRADLAGIWDEADRDRNGQFDREEFVQAMWRIELQTGRVSPPLPARPWNGQAPVPSQQCRPPVAPAYNYPPAAPYQPIPPAQQAPYVQPHGLQTVEILVAIRCKTCGKGLAPSDTVYCSATHHTIDYFCPTCHRPPTATQVLLAAGQDLPQRKRSSMGCSGCWKDIKKGKMVWHCNKCWDKDLCQKCWGKTKKQCKHAATGQVSMMRVGKGGSGEDDDELIADVIDGVVSIATGGL
ncbi:hypothetical protein NCS52_00606000 [Fusarium sp. LHS14.1]|nr:hypothetical protein NCS52_00606000 [Fusarium sp. LHS14.1]